MWIIFQWPWLPNIAFYSFLPVVSRDCKITPMLILTFSNFSGLASAHPLDALQNLQSVDCKGNYGNQNKTKIAVEFADKVFSKMTFRESIPAEIGDNLLDLLEEYAMDNPKTLKFEGGVVEDSHYQIISINNIQVLLYSNLKYFTRIPYCRQ